MQPQQVLDHIRNQPKGRSSFKNLIRLLRVKGRERARLQEALDELVENGSLIENRRGHYRLPGPRSGFTSGRFSQHPAGYGFVQPARPIAGVAGDIYIGPRNTADAMHLDRVLVELTRIGTDGRAEGRIKKVLFRQQMAVVGRFQYSRGGSVVQPHDDRVAGPIEVIRGGELPALETLGERLGNVQPPTVEQASDLDGMIVTVGLVELPTRFQAARGRVIEILGNEDDFGVDVEVVIRKFHIPDQFSSEALAEAEQVAEEIDEAEIQRRRDFRAIPVVTIDGETARDFDDGVFVEKLANGRFALQVHIADVSHFVRPGTALDKEARRRGNSVYFPDRAVPMLPARLSTDICSLNPHADRLTLSVALEIDEDGETVQASFDRGIIRSAERMTYTKVFQALEGDPEVCERYHDHVERFRLMRQLAEILIQKRRRRGAIDLDLPEPVIEFDDKGRMTGVRRSERNIAHRLIEEFMLAANEAVARRLLEAHSLFLHRIHEKPSGKSLLEFERIARSFGYSLGIETGAKTFQRSRRRRDGSKSLRRTEAPADIDVSSRELQVLAEKIRGRPEERILSQRLLRSLKQARYSEEPKGHFALATDAYLHFTSPIRRYPDLATHRILKDLLDKGRPTPYTAKAPGGPLSIEELANLADETSMTERRAAEAERELIDWKKAKFLEERLGDEFAAMVVAVTEGGLWIELEDLYIDGFVPVEAFGGERVYYRENLRALVGSRSKRQFGLGDRLRVRADRVSWDRLRAEFSYLGPAKPAGGPAVSV